MWSDLILLIGKFIFILKKKKKTFLFLVKNSLDNLLVIAGAKLKWFNEIKQFDKHKTQVSIIDSYSELFVLFFKNFSKVSIYFSYYSINYNSKFTNALSYLFRGFYSYFSFSGLLIK